MSFSTDEPYAELEAILTKALHDDDAQAERWRKPKTTRRYLQALQPLLIVGEPGYVWVRLGISSHAGGTAQNDTLEHWKTLTEAHSRVYNRLRSMASKKVTEGDTIQAGILQKEADSLHIVYSATTRRMADGVGKGPLYDFLSRFFR